MTVPVGTTGSVFIKSGNMARFCALALGLFVCLAGVQANQNVQVVGGTYAYKGQYPYLVLFANSNSVPYCSGTLISATRVLTSAWCTLKMQLRDFAVMNTITTTPDADRVLRRVSWIVRNPAYNQANSANDIAIVTLDASVPSTAVPPVLLGLLQPLYAGNVATIIGFGYTGSSLITTYLRTAPITVQQKTYCGSVLNNPIFADANHICLASTGIASCSVDAGGPILYQGRQIAIASFSRCGGGEPVAAVLVDAYKSWILSNI